MLGNLLLDRRAALLFIDWANGTLLHLQGEVEILWDQDGGFEGAERLWRISVTGGWRRAGRPAAALVLRRVCAANPANRSLERSGSVTATGSRYLMDSNDGSGATRRSTWMHPCRVLPGSSVASSPADELTLKPFDQACRPTSSASIVGESGSVGTNKNGGGLVVGAPVVNLPAASVWTGDLGHGRDLCRARAWGSPRGRHSARGR